MRQLKITKSITHRDSFSLNKYLSDISTIPLLTQDEEQSLPSKIQEGDQIALKRFVEGNLRFVISVAKQYQGSGERLEDLINAGNEGLIVAVKRFDTSRGFKFISYGVWWIRQSIMQYITENAKSIRLPANKVAILNKIKSANSMLEQKLFRTPTSEEIAEYLAEKGNDITSEDVDILFKISIPVSSLDLKLSDDSDSSLADLIPSNGLSEMLAEINKEDTYKVIKKLFAKKLSPKEREILIMFFGLFGNQSKTLEEIGDSLDLTRERVRQIKEKALTKLKNGGAKLELKEYL